MIDIFSGIDYVGSLLDGIWIGVLMFAPYILIAATVVAVGELILNCIIKK